MALGPIYGPPIFDTMIKQKSNLISQVFKKVMASIVGGRVISESPLQKNLCQVIWRKTTNFGLSKLSTNFEHLRQHKKFCNSDSEITMPPRMLAISFLRTWEMKIDFCLIIVSNMGGSIDWLFSPRSWEVWKSAAAQKAINKAIPVVTLYGLDFNS